MKAVQMDTFGLQHLQIRSLPKPTPQPNEVLVQIKAVSLNYLDIALAKGDFHTNLPFPYIPASDGTGIVEAVGSAVTQWKPGDRVTIQYVREWKSGKMNAAHNAVRVAWQTQGVLAEYVCVPDYGLVRSPDNLSFEEASTLPIAGLTAWEALINQAHLQIGQTVLTQGTGGVSVFALQIAKAAGAKVIATTSTAAKADKLIALGADEVINYKEVPEWHKTVRELTQGEGVDITLDIAGSSTIAQSMQSIKPHGFVGTAGFLSGQEISLNITTDLNLNFSRVQGFAVGSAESFAAFVRAVEINNIKPVVDTVFTITQVQEAYRYVESGNHFGKVVITL